MQIANLASVKNDLSRYVALVRRGGRVRILIRGVPVADLVPIEDAVGSGDADDAELAELARLGIVRPGVLPSAREQREIDKPGPRVRGGKAVETLIAERRSGR